MRRVGVTATSAIAALLLGVSLEGSAVALTAPPAGSRAVSVAAADEARDALSASVEAAWEQFMAEVTRAKAVRRKALRAPRADLADALTSASTGDDRILARQAYARIAAAAHRNYRETRGRATDDRNDAIAGAVDDYLRGTDQTVSANAAQRYRAAVAKAGQTLRLAFSVSRESYRTDTADEREVLTIALAGASGERARDAAWTQYKKATADERIALRAATLAARSTQRSAVAKARRQFQSTSGHSVAWLADLGERG